MPNWKNVSGKIFKMQYHDLAPFMGSSAMLASIQVLLSTCTVSYGMYTMIRQAIGGQK